MKIMAIYREIVIKILIRPTNDWKTISIHVKRNLSAASYRNFFSTTHADRTIPKLFAYSSCKTCLTTIFQSNLFCYQILRKFYHQHCNPHHSVTMYHTNSLQVLFGFSINISLYNGIIFYWYQSESDFIGILLKIFKNGFINIYLSLVYVYIKRLAAVTATFHCRSI